MLFLIFEKDISKKLCEYFEIHEYPFFNILKFNKQKTVPSILRLVNMRFLIFEMGISKKTVPAILRFVSIPFLTFTKEDQQKNCARYFKIRNYVFFNI